MGFYYTTSPENAVPGKSWVPPKTHTPGSRLEKRGYRYYNPGMGRWTSRDPIGEAGFIATTVLFDFEPIQTILERKLMGDMGEDPNAYQFIGNAPTDGIDAFGLDRNDPPGSVSAPCCGGKVYEPNSQCCEDNKAVDKVDMWVCTRRLLGSWHGIPPRFLPRHKYVCCDAANGKECYGHKDNNYKKGDPIDREGSTTGTCELRKVCPKNKKSHCNHPVSPCDAGTWSWNCRDWAEWDGVAPCP